jgi:hypothetical protein
MELNKYKKALRLFAKVCNETKKKEKYIFLGPLRRAGLSKPESEKLGFKISHEGWQNCLDKRKRNPGKSKSYIFSFCFKLQLFFTVSHK